MIISKNMVYNELMNQYFKDKGVITVGYGSLNGLGDNITRGYPYGICIVLPLDGKVIERIPFGPDLSCFEAINATNSLLKKIGMEAQEFIEKQGYKAFSQARVKRNDNYATPLPHKTVATRAGLGWIGKSCQLVMKEFGSAIRISSILTDMPFITADPINRSQCGDCNLCVTVCPARAIRGENWDVHTQRDALLDLSACRGEIARRNNIFGTKGGAICAVCSAMCKYSQEYLRRAKG
jgi:epoxyqueuosine reductase